MSTKIFSTFTSSEGSIMILTKVRIYFFLRMPRTSIMPYNTSQFIDKSIQIRWNTSNKLILEKLHSEIITLVKTYGLNDLHTLYVQNFSKFFSLLPPAISCHIKSIL